MNKLTKITAKQYSYGVFALFLFGSYILVSVVYAHQRSQIANLQKLLDVTSQIQHASSGGTYTAATIIPSEEAVYLPLAKLKLPANDTTLSLVYTYTPSGKKIAGDTKSSNANLSISTHDLSWNNYSTAQFDCSQVIYADFVTPSYPMSPMWKSDGSIKLADGRTMNVYYAPSIAGCEQTWALNNIDSKAIAESLLQSNSY